MITVHPWGWFGRVWLGVGRSLPAVVGQPLLVLGYRAGVFDADLDAPSPGKFEGSESQLVAELVYAATLDGADDECGDVTENGLWAGLLYGLDLPGLARRAGYEPLVATILEQFYGRLTHAVVTEDSYGFVSVGTYREPSRAGADYDRTAARIASELEAIEAAEGEEATA